MQHLLLAFVLLSAALPLAAQNSTFESVAGDPVVSTPGESLDLLWVDVDGDGDLDLLVVEGNGPAAERLFVNQGDGTFVAVAGDPLVTTASNSTSGSFADVEGDGDRDVLVTNRTGTGNHLFLNQGGSQGGTEGTFALVVAGPVVQDAGDSQDAVWLDIDADGDLDLFVANASDEDNFLYANQGGVQGGTAGTFVRLLANGAVGDAGWSSGVAAGDLDGDGSPDLFVTNSNAQADFSYRNDGNGMFTRVLTGPAVTDDDDGQAAALGDVDNDGDLDLIVANFLDPNSVYLNQGGAQLGTEGDFVQVFGGSLGAPAPTLDVALADWNLDGRLDVALANCCGNDNGLFLGNGTGLFQLVGSNPVTMDGGSSTGLAFGDYDRDGAPDLAVANFGAGPDGLEFLYHNRTPGTYARRTVGDVVTDVQQVFGIAVGDMDGDGDDDVFVPNHEGLPDRLYVNQGGAQGGTSGELLPDPTSALWSTVGRSFGAAFGDMDGDGDLDLAVANRDGQNNQLYRNQGGAQGGTEGTFVSVTSGPVVSDGGSSRDVRWADVDGDGDGDLFFANSNDQPQFLYLNQGGKEGGVAGTFLLDGASPVVTDGGKSYGGDFGDMDGDGDPDLFVAERQGGDNRLYVNQGGVQGGTQGEFLAETSGPMVNDGGDSYAGTWGDMDNDGDLDLIVANIGTNFLYRNQGGAQGGSEGDFVAVTGANVVTAAGSSRRAEWADIDADGDNDLFVPETAGDNALYRNVGGGSFLRLASAIVSSDGGNSRSAAFSDLDGDGDPELIVANHDQPLAVYDNLGPFGPSQWIDLGASLAGVSGAPMMSGSGSLLPNTQVTLQLQHAAPSTTAFLLVGGGTLNLPFLGGTLVPTPDLILGFATNANGYASLQGVWPHNLIAGTSIYFQTWLVDAVGPFGYSATNGLQAVSQ